MRCLLSHGSSSAIIIKPKIAQEHKLAKGKEVPFTKSDNIYLIFFILIALFVRLVTFIFFIQPEMRYQQPDSNDYHTAALCITYGHGMQYPNGTSIFWRTPGYP